MCLGAEELEQWYGDRPAQAGFFSEPPHATRASRLPRFCPCSPEIRKKSRLFCRLANTRKRASASSKNMRLFNSNSHFGHSTFSSTFHSNIQLVNWGIRIFEIQFKYSIPTFNLNIQLNRSLPTFNSNIQSKYSIQWFPGSSDQHSGRSVLERLKRKEADAEVARVVYRQNLKAHK